MSWKLQYGGTAQTLAAWGISDMVKETKNLGVTVLTFSVVLADATIDTHFPHEASIVVYWDDGGSGIIFFRGRVLDPTSTIDPDSERHDYRAEGAWRYLERTPLLQLWKDLVNDAFVPFGWVFLTCNVTGDGLPSAEENGISIQRMVQNAMDEGRPISLGTFDTGIRIPAQQKRGIQISEGIQLESRWTPDAVAWFDDTPAHPAFHWRRATSLDTVSFAVTEIALPIRPSSVIRVPGVRITYMALQEPTEDDEEKRDVHYSIFTKDEYPEDFGTPEGRLELAMNYRDFIDSTPPANLAQALYEAFNENGWSGTLRHQGQELIAITDAARAPSVGRRLNVTGGNSDWTAMHAIIQSVTENVFSGVTTATFGPPEHLGTQDIIQLALINRVRNPVTDANRDWQFEGKKEKDPEHPDNSALRSVQLVIDTTVDPPTIKAKEIDFSGRDNGAYSGD